MKGLLVRVGIDQSYGHWNAPVDPVSNEFVYVPIPESTESQFVQGLERSYSEFMPALTAFCSAHRRHLYDDLKFPSELLGRYMHLDPDFDTLTYGDQGSRRGAGMVEMKDGDFLAFYAGLRPIRKWNHNLLYALVGLYIVEEVKMAHDVASERRWENAHTRKKETGSMDIVVYAKKGFSGRLNRCIPIGEWRDNAYRVREDVLHTWGGLKVKDGFIQRSAVPPPFLDPEKFFRWFQEKEIGFIKGNN